MGLGGGVAWDFGVGWGGTWGWGGGMEEGRGDGGGSTVGGEAGALQGQPLHNNIECSEATVSHWWRLHTQQHAMPPHTLRHLRQL